MKNILLFIFGALTVAFGTSTFFLYTNQNEWLLNKLEYTLTKTAPSPPQKKDISGQIFIVTRGGASVPLGGVIVSIYSYNDLKGLLPKIYKSIAKNVDVYSEKFAEEYAKEETLSLEYEKAAKKSQNAASKIYRKEKQVAREREAAYWAIYHATSAKNYFDALPKPYFTTQTDFNGKFKIALSSTGTLVAVACASRLIGDKTERYCWFTKTDGSNEILMNNHNMFGQISSDTAIPMPELPTECGYRHSCKDQVDNIRAYYAPYFVNAAITKQ